jgi:hypothetical protein
MPPERRDRIERNFHKYGVMALLFARMLPGIRSPIFIMAGIMRLPLRRFLLADGLYAIPGVSLLFFLSYWFGQQFLELVERTEKKIEAVKSIAIVFILGGVTFYLLMSFFRRPISTGDPKELPLIGDKMAAKISKPDLNDPVTDNSHVPPSQVFPPREPASPIDPPSTGGEPGGSPSVGKPGFFFTFLKVLRQKARG